MKEFCGSLITIKANYVDANHISHRMYRQQGKG